MWQGINERNGRSFIDETMYTLFSRHLSACVTYEITKMNPCIVEVISSILVAYVSSWKQQNEIEH
jgi:hypothetical protein